MDATYNQPGNPWQLGTTGGRIARWVFGFGFFSVDLGLYLSTGLILLVINLLRNPADLWVGGPLFRWGVLVFVHFLGAVVCWAVTTAMDAARETRAESETRAAAMPPVPMPAPQYVAPEPELQDAVSPPRPRFQPAPSTPAAGLTEEDSRRAGFRSWRGETPYSDVKPRTSPPGWTVMGPGTPPAPSTVQAETVPPKTDPIKEGAAVIGEPAITVAPVEGDQRWTWVEAAAEAWLANRAGSEPPKPETLPAEAPVAGIAPESTLPDAEPDSDDDPTSPGGFGRG